MMVLKETLLNRRCRRKNKVESILAHKRCGILVGVVTFLEIFPTTATNSKHNRFVNTHICS